MRTPDVSRREFIGGLTALTIVACMLVTRDANPVASLAIGAEPFSELETEGPPPDSIAESTPPRQDHDARPRARTQIAQESGGRQFPE